KAHIEIELLTKELHIADDEEIEYHEIPLDDVDMSDIEEEEESLDKVVQMLHQKNFMDQQVQSDGCQKNNFASSEIKRYTETLDDFIRNFFIQYELENSLDAFQNDLPEVDDLQSQNIVLNAELHKAQEEIQAYKSSIADFHRLHHKRIAQEKNRLLSDYKKLANKLEQIEPTLKHWQQKYELLMKEKTMITLERDKMIDEKSGSVLDFIHINVALQNNIARNNDDGRKSVQLSSNKALGNYLPNEDRNNPFAENSEKLTSLSSKALSYKAGLSIKAHSMAVSSKNLLLSTSDDRTWKLWSVPSGEHIRTGNGHKDWVADSDFHPNSGDGTIRLWNIDNGQTVRQLKDHTQPVWTCAFHDLGDFLASGSMDQTARLFDLRTVNFVTFKPYTNLLWSCSGDRTISQWDARTGICTQSLYGHMNAGTLFVSCDLDGVVKVWDTRNTRELKTNNFGPSSVQKVVLDARGTTIALAQANGDCKL
ncbi:WD40 repeat-like protein, partial [Rozella allomycis CSF55]